MPSYFVNEHVSKIWFVVSAGHIRRSMIWQDPICAGLHDTGLDLFRNA